MKGLHKPLGQGEIVRLPHRWPDDFPHCWGSVDGLAVRPGSDKDSNL